MRKHMVSFKIVNIKYIFFCLLFLSGVLLRPITGLAGSVPEDLLHSDDAMLFFGEIKSIDGDSVTVVQLAKIKGAFSENAELTYDECWLEHPEEGKVYLCGYFDENNPLYLWETDSCNPETLTILQKDEMAQRLQQYLNEGRFTEEEAARQQRLEQKALKEVEREIRYQAWETQRAITRQMETERKAVLMTVSAVSADGPSAVFLAGKFSAMPVILAGAGILLAVSAAILLVRRKRGQ